MAKTATNLRPFDPTDETWEMFMARFDCFLGANDGRGLPDDRKRDIFLHHCGKLVFRTAIALLSPTPVQAVSWQTLQEALKGHYAPTPSKYAQRFEFRQRLQKEGEGIHAYVAALREAALLGDYGAGLDEALLEQFLCGIRDVALRQQLFQKHDLTWLGAVREAAAYELSNKAAAYIQNPKGAQTPGATGIHQTATRAEADETDGAELGDDDADMGDIHQTNQRSGGRSGRCGSCGGDHYRRECRFRDAECRKCGKVGHIARACRSGLPNSSSRQVERQNGRRPDQAQRARAEKHGRQEKGANLNSITISRIGKPQSATEKKKYTTVHIEGAPVKLEVDTGSPITVIPWNKIHRILPSIAKRQLSPQTVLIRDFQGNRVPVEGSVTVNVTYGEKKTTLPLTILRGELPSLMGWDWIEPLGIGLYGLQEETQDIRELQIGSDWNGEDLLREFQSVFDGALGKYVGTPISFNIDPGVAPIRLRARRVPFALKPKIDTELDKLITQGILVPVDHAKWETPIVTPVKPDGSVRICADYKATLNRAMQKSAYPVPVVHHLLHSLGPGNIFAKLDLAQAYQQLPVDDATAEAQTIVTHRGAFKCTRLQFGVSVAPGLFQNLMERILQGIPGVVPYFDDILVSAKTPGQLRDRLREVLTRLGGAGLKLKRNKCQIGVRSVEFLGYRIDGQGIHPTESKVRAIHEAPTPRDKAGLQAFLGLLNFYAMFLQQKATVAEPLHRLLTKNTPWVWGEREHEAFTRVKELVTNKSILIQYNHTLPLVLACDASPYGVGAVLGHRLPDGREAPIAYFSRTLSSPERNYSQLDREALAAVAGVRKFHEYLFGRKFELITDHRPLLGLLAGDKQTPQALSPRMTRWTLFLAAYNYELKHRPGREMGNADALSRCPLPELVEDPTPGHPTMLIDCLSKFPLTAAKLAQETRRDPSLRTVLAWVLRGWPADRKQAPPELDTYYGKREEFTAQGGVLLRGDRVVIPEKHRKEVLGMLHEGHPGIVRMKGLARSYVWWPGMDKQIEGWVEKCAECQQSRPSPPEATVREWDRPRGPWTRIHIDFAGPCQGQTFLILVDAFSKWLEVIIMKNTTAEAVIRALRSIFRTHGLPDILVSDNGPQFTATQFENYLGECGIKHILSAPYKPSTNGQAERFVRATKEALARVSNGDWQEKIDNFLAAQHTTPCPTTGLSPAELLMGRKLRCPLDRLHPNYSPDNYQGGKETREFKIGDQVFIKNYNSNQKWIEGEVTEQTGPKSYRVYTGEGKIERRHIDQIRKRTSTLVPTQWTPPQQTAGPTGLNVPCLPLTASSNPDISETLPVPRELQRRSESRPPSEVAQPEDNPQENVSNNPKPGPHPEQEPERRENTSAQHAFPANNDLRRSSRARERPAYLKDYVCAICR